jgi:signal transduction histidine kinase
LSIGSPSSTSSSRRRSPTRRAAPRWPAKIADRELQDQQDRAFQLVKEALAHAESATHELRELAHGILPTVLTRGGLRAGAEALASRTPIPVEVDVSAGWLPEPIEATAYFVVAEAVTNVAKHARAQQATVTAHVATARCA